MRVKYQLSRRSNALGGISLWVGGQLLHDLAPVALAVRVEIAVVDLRGALHEHLRSRVDPEPVGSEKSIATRGSARASFAFFG